MTKDQKFYVELAKRMNFKTGDRVKVLRKAFNHELGWQNSWAPEMDEYIGKTFIISPDIDTVDVTGIEVGDEFFDFPCFVLEKVGHVERITLTMDEVNAHVSKSLGKDVVVEIV